VEDGAVTSVVTGKAKKEVFRRETIKGDRRVPRKTGK